MNKSNKYSPAVRERAVRMVQEHRSEYPSRWAAIESIAPKIGCSAHTWLEWVRKHEIDTGLRDGVTSEKRERINAGMGGLVQQPPPAGTDRIHPSRRS